MRTPLAALQMGAELLEALSDQDDPKLRQQAMSSVKRNTTRINEMAQRLLDVSRIAAGKRLPLEIEKLDLAALLQEFVEEFHTIFSDVYGVEVELDLPEEALNDRALVGWWNWQALWRVVNNLVENAIRYGNPPITISASREGDEVWVSVHNHGEPIPIKKQGHIFQRFVRLEPAERQHRSGWGLGLTLVSGLAEAMGGEPHLQSDECRGTKFSVRLPLDARPAQF